MRLTWRKDNITQRKTFLFEDWQRKTMEIMDEVKVELIRGDQKEKEKEMEVMKAMHSFLKGEAAENMKFYK
jgi:hypothetical protein